MWSFVSACLTIDFRIRRKEAQKCYCEAENCRGWIGEEPDSEDEVEEEEDEEDDGVEESEEDEDVLEEEEVTPITTELTGTPATIDDHLVEPPDVDREDTSDVQVSEKSILVIKTPSPTKKIRKPKPKPEPKLKKFKIKKSEIMVDPDLDHEIANLMETNLKNQAHTLRFSRLMVRAKMLSARSQLLSILRSGELACRRLFLDYHGLKLLHTWMCDPVTNNAQQEWAFRLDILETLEVLPIPNKNMLQDSKVLVIVRKWANIESIKENVKSPEESPCDSGSATPISEGSPKVEDAKNVDSSKAETIEQSKVPDSVVEGIDDSSKKDIESPKEITDSSVDVIEATDSTKEISDASKVAVESAEIKETSKTGDVTESDGRDSNTTVVEPVQLKSGEERADDELMEQIRYMTSKLLESWEQLKEVFRIPKKLRIEQMKEHEQEANRITDFEDSNKRYNDASKDRDRFKKEKRSRPIEANDPDSVFLKVQRRRLFEAQVTNLGACSSCNALTKILSISDVTTVNR